MLTSNVVTFPAVEPEYLDAAALAAIIRADLRAAFAGVRFSVRTSRYSMGSSVHISWTDGPISATVDDHLARYRAQGFDGSTDSTTNSGPVRLDDGRLVSIHSYVSTSRSVSPALRARCAAWLERHPEITAEDGPDAIHRVTWRACLVGSALHVRRPGAL